MANEAIYRVTSLDIAFSLSSDARAEQAENQRRDPWALETSGGCIGNYLTATVPPTTRDSASSLYLCVIHALREAMTASRSDWKCVCRALNNVQKVATAPRFRERCDRRATTDEFTSVDVELGERKSKRGPR